MCKCSRYFLSMSHMAPSVNTERIARPRSTSITCTTAIYFLIEAVRDVSVTYYNIQRRDGRD